MFFIWKKKAIIKIAGIRSSLEIISEMEEELDKLRNASGSSKPSTS